MKLYIGIPGTPAAVAVTDSDGTRPLAGDFAWGKSNPPARANLAKAILREQLGDEDAVEKYFGRFLWRTVIDWPADKPWKISDREVDAVLASIREGERDVTVARLQANSALPPIESEGGIGPGGAAVSKIEKR